MLPILSEALTLAGVSCLVETVRNVVELSPVRGSRDARVFEQVIDPIFRDLDPAVTDLLALFVTAQTALEAARGPDDTRAALADLKARRAALFAARVSLREQCDALRDASHDERINRFLRQVERVFWSMDHDPHRGRKMSRSVEVLTLMEMLARDEVAKEPVTERLAQTVAEIESAYVAAADIHAHEKVRALKRLLRK